MPPLIMPEIETFAERDPLLYEALTRIQASINGVLLSSGQGSPQNALTASPGAVYFQLDAPPSGAAVIWVKDSGVGNTGWVNLGLHGSVPPQLSTHFAYTSTTGSITWYWDGTNGSDALKVYRPDGTSFPASGSVTISGLNSATTYYFYPYWDERLQTVSWVVGTQGNTPSHFAFLNADRTVLSVQTQNLLFRVPLSQGSISAATPASGTGGGSGIGGIGGHGPLSL